jgi:ABC-2 type transport system ATP-binding protein
MSNIVFKDVDVWYGDFQALHNISFEIGSGAIGLLGPNGAGKSTAMKTILGFNRAKTGTVTILGHEMPTDALDIRQMIGYMPERDVMSPKMSAVAFLTYCGQLLGMTRVDALERAHEVLNYVNLGEARYRHMETYSTGMLQRVKLGQALIHDPKLLLLDEPTNGLDPDARLEMLDLVRDLAYRRGVTVLLSSHLLPDVQYVCEHILIINDGKVVSQGSMDELTALQDEKFEVRVRDNKNQFIQEVLAKGFECGELKNGDLFISQPKEHTPQTLYEIAKSCNTQIRHFRPARRTLAEAFMHAIGDES